MRKLITMVTLSTLAALGAATAAGTAAALEPDHGVEQAAAGHQDLHLQVESATREAADKLGALATKGGSESVHDLFEMAMVMNHFSQISDMATDIVSHSNAAITHMTRGIKG